MTTNNRSKTDKVAELEKAYNKYFEYMGPSTKNSNGAAFKPPIERKPVRIGYRVSSGI